MRIALLLLLTLLPAACDRPSAAADSRRPLLVHLRAGEFLRAEYVDSAWAASGDPQSEARTRALGLWREYGAPELDSVVLRVSNREEVGYDAEKHTRSFNFTLAELTAGAAAAAQAASDPTRPMEVEIHSRKYIRAVYVDSALVAAEQHDRLLAFARDVVERYGGPVDSVMIEVSNGAPPGQVQKSLRNTFTPDDLRDR